MVKSSFSPFLADSMEIGKKISSRIGSLVILISFVMQGLLMASGPLKAQNGSAFRGVTPDHLYLPSAAKSQRVSTTDPNFDGNGDSRLIQPGETLVLADLQGPGIIKHMWNTTASLHPYSSRGLIFRIYWDGSDKPSVEVPLGDFFGVGLGAKKDFQSALISVSSHGRAQTCYWEMPFRQRARITLTNELSGFGPAYCYFNLDWEKVDHLPADLLYFHARYHQQNKPLNGDHIILSTTGQGNYVGTVYSALQVQNGWFGEGDERVRLDGETTPSLQGTGTEDYFNDAWGFREFAGPYHGVPLYDGPLTGDRVSAYRWHIVDPIRFRKSIQFSIEHRGSKEDLMGKKLAGSDERPDRISSVAFWYQTPVTFSPDPLPPVQELLPPCQVELAATLPFRATPNKTRKETVGVVFEPEVPDGRIDFEFNLQTSGTYKVSAILVDNLFGSLYQPMIDGEAVGPLLDLASKGGDWSEYLFDCHRLEKGKHLFSLVGKGKSPFSRTLIAEKFAIGISSLILLRTDNL